MNEQILWPWKMVGKFADGSEITVGDYDEYNCMGQLIELQDKHGELTWYTGLCDEDYVDGEYIGAENFIYE